MKMNRDRLRGERDTGGGEIPRPSQRKRGRKND